MKNRFQKLSRVLLSLCFIFLSSCSSPSKESEPSKKSEGDSVSMPSERSTSLVTYFSWSDSGNTRTMAEYIQGKTDSDIYEIKPATPYPTIYSEMTGLAEKEKEENARPKIQNPIDISGYRNVFLGFPIWWHSAPMIIATFLENYDFTGKEIYPFFQGSDNSNQSYYDETMTFLKTVNPDANIHDGLYASPTDNEKIDEYLRNISSEKKEDTDKPKPMERQTIYLWDEERIPSWRGNLNRNDPEDFKPNIETFPAEGKIKGAILICPGGAFQFKSFQQEGYSVAGRLTKLGYQCFVVSYRLSPYSQKESALDLQRAIRYVRYHASDYGISEKEISIVGFSAGGILCGEVAMNFKGDISAKSIDANYVSDEIDEVSADIKAVGHIYSFYGRLSVSNNDVEELKAASLPPTFYAYGTRDPFYQQFNQNVEAAREAGVQVESHVFEGQPHGFGAGNRNSEWISLFDKFLEGI